ncbi:MAG: hypothetical protein HOP35_14265 [Nitrospira sp.]|nr:hypothetical protein [Nitrospira sp.]
MNFLRPYVIVGFSLLIASCGSGGGDSPTPSPPAASTGFTQTYTASATAGEILTYTIDTQNKTYSYKIIYSAYGLTNATGNGTLVTNSDGSYSPSNAPSTKVYAIQNGLLIGTVNLTLNNVPRIVPILGMAQPIASPAALAGMYNFVGIQCAGQTFGVYTGCISSYGTVQIPTAGTTYTSCPSANIATLLGLGPCSPLSTGTLSLLGNGVWQAIRTGSVNTNYFLAFAAPNGQNVLLLDLNDPGGYGYGFIVMSTQAGYVQNLVDGTWFFQTTAGTAGSLTVAGTQIASSLGPNVSATFDSPWMGAVSISNGGLALLAGTGAYAYINPGFPGFLELGIKK